MNSMLVFIPVLIGVFILIDNYNNFNNDKSLKIKIKYSLKSFVKVADFILLPVLFWIIKMQYFMPLGNYKEYNQVQLSGLLDSPAGLWDTIKASLIQLPIFSISKINSIYSLFFLIFIVLVSFILIKKAISKSNNQDFLKIKTFKIKFFFNISIRIPALLIIGMVLFLAGAFPYVVVGHVPNFETTESRDQILLGIGTSLILYYLLKLIVTTIISVKYRVPVFVFSLAVIVSMFIVSNVSLNIDAVRTFFIHESIKNDFKSSLEIKNSSNFIFVDHFKSRIWRESLRFYSLTGMTKEVFGDQKRFIILESEKDYFIADSCKKFFKEQYNMREARFDGTFDYKIYAKENCYNLSSINVLALLYNKYFNKTIYNKNINNISSLAFDSYN